MIKKSSQRKYIQEFVYGGIDGAITTFAIVAGVMGAALSSTIVLVLGFANLFADGFSMAVSNYLSTKSHNQVASKHMKEHHPKHIKNPKKTAIVTFISFIALGFIPLISFVLGPVYPIIEANKFPISIALTGVAFIIIGAIRGTVTNKSKIRSSIETFVMGAIAALIAYLVGYFLRGMVS